MSAAGRRCRPAACASGCRAPCRCSTACLLVRATSRSWVSRPCFRRSPTRAFRRRASSWPWPSPASRCRWRTDTCRRWWRRAWITSCSPTWWMPKRRRDACASHYCPWNQTLPWVLRAAPALEPHQHQFLIPTLHFQLGPAQVKKELAETMRRIGVTRRASDRAVDAAYAAQREFQDTLLEAGRAGAGGPGADRRARPGAGGPRLQHLRPRRELRYPAQAAPPLRRQRDSAGFPGDRARARRTGTANMYWISGRKILEAARDRRRPSQPAPGLHHQLQVRADSYIKHFAREAAGAPLLVLQFDGHGNDAGFMTRCEAYLDSKGILRCYQQPNDASVRRRRQRPSD